MYVTSLARAFPTTAYVPLTPVLRKILKPSSVVELSTHARLSCVPEAGVTVSPLGAVGGEEGMVVNVQFTISYVAVSPRVPAVKPTHAFFPPITVGMLTA